MATQLLRGIVGSTAYGLNTPKSDIDRLGIHIVETTELFAMVSCPPETITSKDPDFASHELKKACGLMAAGNPTVLEVLWLNEYDIIEPYGQELIDIRKSFFSKKRVRDAYLGYASKQLTRLEVRGRFQGSLDTRREKHARHVCRLMEQGVHLYATGELKLRVDNPQQMHDTARRIAENGEDGVEMARKLIATTEKQFDNIKSPIPDVPDFPVIQDLIDRARISYWEAAQ